MYKLSNKLSTALSYFQKVIEIVRSFSPADDIELTVSYRNMVGFHEALGDYSTALSFYEKTLDLDKNVRCLVPDYKQILPRFNFA